MKRRDTMMGTMFLVALTVSAHAADVEVRCEQRQSPARTRVSVDVQDIAPGMYAAAIASGTNAVVSTPAVTVGDEVAFDFDSNRKDILAGATAISKTFIQGDAVHAQILNTAGAVVAEGSGICRVR